MNAFLYRLLGITVMLVAFWLTARVVVPIVQGQGFGSGAWHMPLTGAAFIGVPILAMVLFELISRRALGWGFSVVRRAESPREYWTWILFHAACLLIVTAATWIYFSSKQ